MTGVQTCALPISKDRLCLAMEMTPRDNEGSRSVASRAFRFFKNFLFISFTDIYLQIGTPATTMAIPSIRGYFILFLWFFNLNNDGSSMGFFYITATTTTSAPPSIGRFFFISHNTTVMNRARGADASRAPLCILVFNLQLWNQCQFISNFCILLSLVEAVW